MFSAMVNTTVVPLILRLGLAAVFIYHGMGKIQTEGNELGTNWQRQMQDPLPRPMQAAVAWGELIGGVAVAVGLLTRLAAAGLGAIMIGAIATVHGKNGFSLASGGFEYNFVLLTICLALVLSGGGLLSLDRMLFRKRRPA